MKRAQHAAHNPKLEKIIQTSVEALGKIYKEPTCMVEGDQPPPSQKDPNPTHIVKVDCQILTL